MTKSRDDVKTVSRSRQAQVSERRRYRRRRRRYRRPLVDEAEAEEKAALRRRFPER
jgi:hypothetical protein